MLLEGTWRAPGKNLGGNRVDVDAFEVGLGALVRDPSVFGQPAIF